MRSHLSILIPRMIRAALKSPCRFRVVAVGLDHRNRLIDICTNTPRLPSRGFHAEERLIHRNPRSLVSILILRVGVAGDLLPIDPCEKCSRMAGKRGIKIQKIGVLL